MESVRAVKIRVEGKPSEVREALEHLKQVFRTNCESKEYKNRRDDRVRVYVVATMADK